MVSRANSTKLVVQMYRLVLPVLNSEVELGRGADGRKGCGYIV